MTPAARIEDCDQVLHELRCDALPWYCSSFRLRQWQANHEAHTFGWMVAQVRGVGDGADLWSEIEIQLRNWESDLVH
jgi:hypothetical protein